MFTHPNIMAGLVFAASAFPGETAMDGKDLAAIKEASRDLVRQAEHLQEDIVEDLDGRRERGLYRSAEAILAEAERFRKSLEAGPPKDRLAKQFDRLDAKVRDLLKDVRALEKQPALKRSAERVAEADERLHLALFAGDPSRDRAGQLLARQARALGAAARRLEQIGQYGLGAEPGHAVLLGDLRKCRAAAEAFEKGVDGSDLEQMRRAFSEVTASWERVARHMAKIKPADGLLFLRAAERLDEMHGRLFRLLGVKGKRPAFTVRT